MSDSEKSAYWNQMWRNSLICDTYEPGSTFKLLTTAIALEEDVTDIDDTFTCTGAIEVAGETIHCWRSENPHGTQSLIQAVGNSCNPVFVSAGNENRKGKILRLSGNLWNNGNHRNRFSGRGYGNTSGGG